MEKLSTSENKLMCRYDYKIPQISNEEQAIQWLIDLAKNRNMSTDYISFVDSTHRFEEGSGSAKFYNVVALNAGHLYRYFCRHQINYISITGHYRKAPVVIGITFPDMTMHVVSRKKEPVAIDELEKEKEFNANNANIPSLVDECNANIPSLIEGFNSIITSVPPENPIRVYTYGYDHIPHGIQQMSWEQEVYKSTKTPTHEKEKFSQS